MNPIDQSNTVVHIKSQNQLLRALRAWESILGSRYALDIRNGIIRAHTTDTEPVYVGVSKGVFMVSDDLRAVVNIISLEELEVIANPKKPKPMTQIELIKRDHPQIWKRIIEIREQGNQSSWRRGIPAFPSISAAFDWDNTLEGSDFWAEISAQNYDHFYKRYPKSEYPKIMQVSDNNHGKAKRVVFEEKCGRYIAWRYAETFEEAEKQTETYAWKYAADIEPEKEIPEYTMEEAIHKMGHEFKIKK